MVGAGHDILFRLTKSRFKRHCFVRREKIDRNGAQRPLSSDVGFPRQRTAKPIRDLPADACLEVYLHEVGVGKWRVLVSGHDADGDQPKRRLSITASLRCRARHSRCEGVVGIENIRAKSDEMVQKELLCSVVAYNLVVQLRREAAKVAGVQPRRLSFTGVWTTMRVCLLQQPPCVSRSGWSDTNAP